MLSFLNMIIYLEKICTLNSMADSLEYLERKQPQVGKKPKDWIILVCLVQVTAHRDLETMADSAGQGPLSLYTQEPNPSGPMNNCKWLFFPNCCGKKNVHCIINCFAKISKNSEIKLLAINSINIVTVN